MKKSLLLIPIISLLFSCKEDTTPSWLEITSIDLLTDETTEGSDSHSIKDAWVYMDNTPLGAFELPCKIPILAEGPHNFSIYAGIQINGINASRTRYPFYESFDTVITLIKKETITIAPVVTYKKNLNFVLKEDFENIGISFLPAFNSLTNLVFVKEVDFPNIVQFGNSCGGIFLTSADSLYKGITHSFLNLPNGEDVFMEIDFMSDNSSVMGVISQNSSDYLEHNPLAGMNRQHKDSMVWKKMYIGLTEDVSFHTSATSHEIYLLSILDNDHSTGVIYLDNIKIICYQ